mmetsp:Transcript_64631/g.104534  ORF Transcript_64631/g.104534 Transcript_64631/m.104534 type:complete len:91 (-) Transcript_64631:939-1211(-)
MLQSREANQCIGNRLAHKMRLRKQESRLQDKRAAMLKSREAYQCTRLGCENKSRDYKSEYESQDSRHLAHQHDMNTHTAPCRNVRIFTQK